MCAVERLAFSSRKGRRDCWMNLSERRAIQLRKALSACQRRARAETINKTDPMKGVTM